MAREDGQEEGEDDEASNTTTNGTPIGENGEAQGEGSEEEEEEEEPRLKYESLTKQIQAVYRNGDATSAFLVSGDKMVTSIIHVEYLY